MVFSSATFLFFFLPCVLGLYYLSPMRGRNALLLLASLVFYAWGEPVYVFLMIGSIGVNWLVGLLMARYADTPREQVVLALGIAFDLILLAYFKYVGFFAASVLAHVPGLEHVAAQFHAPRVPIGISFFTFHAMSYLIDIHRRQASALRNPLNIGVYITMFPQLIAGPIIRFYDVAEQIVKRRKKIAATQTLLFENGTQQASHQDFAFVHSLRPACLMGARVALEDACVDAGPLFYGDRSHRAVPKYAFDDGSVLAEGDGPHVRAFENYLDNACRQRGLERLIFTPRKGDLLIWHSALVHGGMPRNDPALTRRSMVSHYTTQEACPYDRRDPNGSPHIIERNGGIYFGWRREGHIEGRYPLDDAARSVA